MPDVRTAKGRDMTARPTLGAPHLMFFQPRLPGNTGNVIRLAAVTGARLHLIEPLGFDLDEPKLRRAGLDYHDLATVDGASEFRCCVGCVARRPRVRVRDAGDDALLRGVVSAGGCAAVRT